MRVLDAESWPRGRRRSPAKRVEGLYPSRGFESLALRHFTPLPLLDIAMAGWQDCSSRLQAHVRPYLSWIEGLTTNQNVAGSNPAGRTTLYRNQFTCI